MPEAEPKTIPWPAKGLGCLTALGLLAVLGRFFLFHSSPPLVQEVERRDYDALEERLRSGLDPNDCNGSLLLHEDSGLHWYSKVALETAVVQRDREAVQILLAAGASPNRDCGQGTTPLVLAAMHPWRGRILVPLLLQAGGDPGQGAYGDRTALEWSVRKGDWRVSLWLLSRLQGDWDAAYSDYQDAQASAATFRRGAQALAQAQLAELDSEQLRRLALGIEALEADRSSAESRALVRSLGRAGLSALLGTGLADLPDLRVADPTQSSELARLATLAGIGNNWALLRDLHGLGVPLDLGGGIESALHAAALGLDQENWRGLLGLGFDLTKGEPAPDLARRALREGGVSQP